MCRVRWIAVSALVMIVMACGEPAGLDPLAISVAVRPNRIVPGDTTTIVVRFTNTGLTSIDVPLFCQQLFEVANARGQIVAGREPMSCVMVAVPPVRLEPSESVERRFSWNGWFRQQNGDSLLIGPLPPGTYRVYGTLAERRSAPTGLELEPRVPERRS